MTFATHLSSLITPSVTLSSAFLGGIAAFLGSGISGVSLAHLGAGSLAVDEGVRWGTLVGALVAFVVALALLGGLRALKVQKAVYGRAAAWTLVGTFGVPCVVAAAAWFGSTAGAGPGDHLRELVVALPRMWPLQVSMLLMSAAIGLSGYGQNGPT